MISHLTFVRHGQSEANAAGVYAGIQPHVQLTALGREQASAAGKLLQGAGIDHVFASPLDRAHMTAQLIASEINYSLDAITINPNLREIDDGGLTGQPDHGFSEYLEYVAAGTDSSVETPEQVVVRLMPVLQLLATMEPSHVLIVAHAGTGRVLRSLLSGIALLEIAKIDIPNAQPIELPIDRLRELVG